MEGREHVNKVYGHYYKAKFDGIKETKPKGNLILRLDLPNEEI